MMSVWSVVGGWPGCIADAVSISSHGVGLLMFGGGVDGGGAGLELIMSGNQPEASL